MNSRGAASVLWPRCLLFVLVLLSLGPHSAFVHCTYGSSSRTIHLLTIQQTSSKLPANVFKIHVLIARRLLKFAGRLLDRVNEV